MIRARVDWRTTWVLATFIALCMVALFTYWDKELHRLFKAQEEYVRQACEDRDHGVLTRNGCMVGSQRRATKKGQ